MSSPLPIDVVIPAFNAAEYLAESLGSVAAQTLAPARTIVVDDGSEDDTAAIALSHGAIVIRQTNRGLAEARNSGIRASDSAFIALLDADDRWHPERLESQWHAHELRPEAGLLSSDYATWAGGVVGEPVLAGRNLFESMASEHLGQGAVLVRRERLLAAIAQANFVLPSSLLISRRMLVENDLYFTAREHFPENDGVFIGEDYEWLLRVLRHTDVAFVDRVLVDYRVLSTSLSARRGRIRYGDVALGKMIAAKPARYAENASTELAKHRTRALIESGIAHLHAGEMDFVRLRLRELATCGSRPIRVVARPLAWVADSAAGRAVMLRAFRTLHATYAAVRR